MTRLIQRPFHERLEVALRREIGALKPGQKLTSERALAKRFGVSVNTVREAITTFTHEGLLERRAGRGTRVLDQAARQHVAIVTGTHPLYPRGTMFYYRVTEWLCGYFADQGSRAHTYLARYATAGRPPDPALAEFTENLRLGRIRGIILTKGPFDRRWQRTLDQCRRPIVGGASRFRCQSHEPVVAREGTRYLLAAGRRKLALLVAGDPLTAPPRQAEIWRSLHDVFADVLQQQGVAVREEWLRRDFFAAAPGAGYAQFKEIWTAAPDKPDGLVVTDDCLFSDLCAAVLEMGIRVPEQLLIVTQANKDSGMLYPFPTVRLEYDPEQWAERIGQMLGQLMRGEPVLEPNPDWPFVWVGTDPNGPLPPPTSLREIAGLTTKETMDQAPQAAQSKGCALSP